jgi:hypothetical protein
VNDDDRAALQRAYDDDRTAIQGGRAKAELRRAYVNFARTDPETARSLVQDRLKLEPSHVRVVRAIDQPGAETMILEAMGVFLSLGHGQAEDADTELHLLVACPVCETLVAQGCRCIPIPAYTGC